MRSTSPSLLLALAALGCAAARPSTTASPSGGRTIPTSAKALINASVQVTFHATVGALSDLPLEIQRLDEENGVIETPYFDLSRHEWQSERYPQEERLVRIRITVQPDTLGRGSRVAVFVLYQPHRLGMAVGRANERSVASDHPGAAFARKVIGKIEERATGVRSP
ncbi:MAG: hypothetical protein HYS40_01195 [Gemmatimonadetes bacterium]|nr:hypothetical protein [Gemmatimonadota bacterium]